MQAITTKYLPATDTKPSRIKAECQAGCLTLPFSVCDEAGELRGEDPHQRCAYALMNKLGWRDELASGTTKSGIGVHVLTETKRDAALLRHALEALQSAIPKQDADSDEYMESEWNRHHAAINALRARLESDQ